MDALIRSGSHGTECSVNSTQSQRGSQETTMIGRLNHVAIAVPNLEKAAATYRNVLGAKVSEPLPQVQSR